MSWLHLGQDTLVPEEEIVGIFDLDNVSYSHVSRRFLRQAEEAGRVVDVSGELPKSFVLLAAPGGRDSRVYLSQLMSATLLKRSESPPWSEEG